MTVPNLAHKQQEHAMRVKFLKYINIVNQAHRLAWAVEGEDLTPILDSRANNGAIKNQNATKLKTYYKIAKGPWTSYWGGAYDCLYINCQGLYKNAPKWKLLNGTINNLENITFCIFQLVDGAIIAYGWPGIYVDVNGPKGPNTLNIDIFLLGSKVSDGTILSSQVSPALEWGPYGSPKYTYNYSWMKSNDRNFHCNKQVKGYSCAWEIFKNINYEIPEK